jgi:rRNA maturation protein Nop10
LKILEGFDSFCIKMINHPLTNAKLNESNKNTVSYWGGNGKYQKEYDRLWKEHVPESGEAETENGELIRAVGRLFYEYCNNGNCNAATREDEICDECGGDGEVENPDFDPNDPDEEYIDCGYCDGSGNIEGELEINDFYDDFLDLISNKVGCKKEVEAVRDLITDNYLNYNYTYSQDEMDVYNRLTDKVVEFVLKNESEK